MNEVLILLATYNGELYIREQLESLLEQTHSNYTVLISDDCSSDKTVEIIKEIIKKDQRFQLIENSKNIGALKNFNFLINIAKTRKEKYIMFCDQDDIWLPKKIENSCNKINECERGATLVYTKGILVDERLKKVKKNSFIGRKDPNLINLLHQNPIYGCTTIINRALLDYLTDDIPVEFINHDHYVAYIAKLYGIVIFLDIESMLYRQHNKNVSGSSITPLYKKILKISNLTKNIKLFYFLIDYTIREHYEILDKKEKYILKGLQERLKQEKKIEFLSFMLKNRIYKTSFLGSINFYTQIFKEKKWLN